MRETYEPGPPSKLPTAAVPWHAMQATAASGIGASGMQAGQAKYGEQSPSQGTIEQLLHHLSG